MCASVASNPMLVFALLYPFLFFVSALSFTNHALSTAQTLCALANCAAFNDQFVLVPVDDENFVRLVTPSFNPKERTSFSSVLSIRSDLALVEKSSTSLKMSVYCMSSSSSSVSISSTKSTHAANSDSTIILELSEVFLLTINQSSISKLYIKPFTVP